MRRIGRWRLVSAALVAAATATATASCASKEPEAATFTVRGTVAVDAGNEVVRDGEPCSGVGGYDDMRQGAPVAITADDGKTLALGKLEEGRFTPGRCTFKFAVGEVPAGHKFYGVEVGHRGVIKETEEDVRRPLALSLG